MNAHRRELLDDYRSDWEDSVEFRLVYSGPLLATQRDPVGSQKDPKAEHKYPIRREFHKQLMRLWEITPFLKTGERSGPSALLMGHGADAPSYDQASLAKKHARYGFNFVPLVTHELDLICALDILFLRPDKPGEVLWAGDIDNRLKTLFDALKIPDAGERYSDRTPEADEKPFFCLLEDDRLITKVSVETDQLLDFDPSQQKADEAHLVITVRLRPYELTLGNMQFG